MHRYLNWILFDFFSPFVTDSWINLSDWWKRSLRFVELWRPAVTSRIMAIMAHFLPSLCFISLLLFVCINAASVPPSNSTCPTSNCSNVFIIGPPLQQNHQLQHWTGEPSISYKNQTLYLSNHPSYTVRYYKHRIRNKKKY